MNWRVRAPRGARWIVLGAVVALGLCGGELWWQTRSHLLTIPEVLPPAGSAIARPRITDRAGVPLAVSFQNRWNTDDPIAYHDVPELLRQALVVAEDQRFFGHSGVDWRARLHAAWQNLVALRPVRGASTLSEQAVRILHPRPRTLWSRWLEGFEARALERRFRKTEILEFYLNQVPYARERRGVAQAARLYFDRDLDTLDPQEMLTLVVLVRSPSRLDPLRDPAAPRRGVIRLARRLEAAGLLSAREVVEIESHPLQLAESELVVPADHWARFVRAELEEELKQGLKQELEEPAATGAIPAARRIQTTLDGSLQAQLQRHLDRTLADLAERGVSDGAVLVVDHSTDEILAWVNGGGLSEREGEHIDMVLAPRQPGSTLKPFVYALALERGWTAATILEDSPLVDPVGHGLHSYRNYSRSFYGPVRLREALGNSLNIPAVRAVKYVGPDALLERLQRLGFSSLDRHPDFYGDGLALGNGEVSLYSLVRAYATLARGGIDRPLRFRFEDSERGGGHPLRLFDAEVSALIADILADPQARRLEFGSGSVLELPFPAAVKTGTSSDHRDAWAVGFSSRYVVGVWMGNVDRRPMLEVSGSIGPGMVLRAAFAELNRHRESGPLLLSRRLVRLPICRDTGALAGERCPAVSEWFAPEHLPVAACPVHGDKAAAPRPRVAAVQLESPTPGLHLALDPRIPDELERFPLAISGAEGAERVEWWVDGRLSGATAGETAWLWPLERGRHTARARVWLPGASAPLETQTIAFQVK